MNIAKDLRSAATAFALRFHTSPVEVPEWHVPARQLREITIEWPTRYAWPAAVNWVDLLLVGLSRRVRIRYVSDIDQNFRGTMVCRFSMGSGASHLVAIDYSDYPEINEDLASRAGVYFKMQFREAGYAQASAVPGGYVPDSRRLYFDLAALRRLRDSGDFRFDVYGRFGAALGTERRTRATAILTSSGVAFEGGLNKVPLREFLREIAQSRVCIDLPGEGALCYRLVNYLAIGSCVVSPPHGVRLHVPLNPGEHIAYCRTDLSDLAEVSARLVKDSATRERMAAASRAYFDRNLHKDNLAAYYLRTCVDRLA